MAIACGRQGRSRLLARMKFARCTIICNLLSLGLYAQDGVPAEFMEQLEREVGVWIADNSVYRNDQEPYAQFGIVWEWGIGRKSLKGRLYGLAGGRELGTFWEFHKYWDPAQNKVMVVQFGADGTMGIGPVEPIPADGIPELVQVFTEPGGTSHRSGHTAIWMNDSTHVTTSFVWNVESEEWIKQRSYTWTKVKIGTE